MSISFFSDIVTTSAPPVAGLLAQPAATTAPQATAASTIRRPTGVVIAYLSGVGRPSLEAPRQGAKFPRRRRMAGWKDNGAPWRPVYRPGEESASAARVLLSEAVDPAARVDDLLLAGVERMAVRAHLDLEVLTERGAGLEDIAAAARDRDLLVVGGYAAFHAAKPANTIGQRAAKI